MAGLLQHVRRGAGGFYAWLLTVALPAFGPEGNLGGRLGAMAALGALLLGAALTPLRPALGRMLGIYAFGLLSIVAWVGMGSALSLDQLDPVRSALGSLAWILHVLAWSAEGHPAHPSSGEGPALEPRGHANPVSSGVFGFAVVVALGLMGFAFRVGRPDQALLAHAAATLSAVGILGAALDVGFGLAHPGGGDAPRARFGSARAALWGWLALLGLGVLAWRFR